MAVRTIGDIHLVTKTSGDIKALVTATTGDMKGLVTPTDGDINGW